MKKWRSKELVKSLMNCERCVFHKFFVNFNLSITRVGIKRGKIRPSPSEAIHLSIHESDYESWTVTEFKFRYLEQSSRASFFLGQQQLG